MQTRKNPLLGPARHTSGLEALAVMPAREPSLPVRAHVQFSAAGPLGATGNRSLLNCNSSLGSSMTRSGSCVRRLSTSMMGMAGWHATAVPFDAEADATQSKKELEDLSASVLRALKRYGKGIVHPRTAKWVQWWDGMSFLCLIYTAVVTPFEVGLLQPIPIELLLDDLNMCVPEPCTVPGCPICSQRFVALHRPHRFALFVCNRLVDLFFFCDLVLNFFLAYQVRVRAREGPKIAHLLCSHLGHAFASRLARSLRTREACG